MDIKWKNFNNKEEIRKQYFLPMFSVLSFSGFASFLFGVGESRRLEVWIGCYAFFGASILAFFFLWKREEGEEGLSVLFDRLKLETLLLWFALFNLITIFFFLRPISQLLFRERSIYLAISLMFFLFMPMMGMNTILWSALFRHIKKKELRKKSYVSSVLIFLKKIRRGQRTLYHSLGQSILLLFIYGFLFSYCAWELVDYRYVDDVLFLWIAFFFLLVLYCGKRVNETIQMEELFSFLDKLCKGEELDFQSILVKKKYDWVMEDLEMIQYRLSHSEAEQKKSEQMKVDLITNVSHDLKTPLTSIIGYIDLLKKETELSEAAKDYIEVLGNKSEHLKDMIQDLFEISKATSGTMETRWEELEMHKLLEQTLGDMEDAIIQSGREIRKEFEEKAMYFLGDGKYLYRVYQNLLENALKYSMEGTRIYMELYEEESQVVTVIKNIAGYEMKFNKEEMKERFVRGDESRTSEGNGLGLAIAESFTTMCQGDFQILIDGDLFKVILKFDLLT